MLIFLDENLEEKRKQPTNLKEKERINFKHIF